MSWEQFRAFFRDTWKNMPRAAVAVAVTSLVIIPSAVLCTTEIPVVQIIGVVWYVAGMAVLFRNVDYLLGLQTGDKDDS